VPVNQRRKAERLLEGARVQPQWVRPPSADEIIERDAERLLADASLSQAISDDESGFVKTLLETHGAEQVAAAFIRLYHSGRSAPEELTEVSVDNTRKPRRENAEGDTNTAPRRDRNEFSDSAWFSLSVGRKQSAEPRWLIPMLCRFGKLTRQDIGAIRMQQNETYVELAADAVDRFVSSIGKDMALEKGIRVKALEGKPDMSTERRDDRSFERRDEKRGERRDDRPASGPKKFGGKPDFAAKTSDKPWKKKDSKPKFEKTGDNAGKPPAKKDKPFAKRKPKA
jgi:ATP-dependent RNA helicase DeaD